MERELIEHKRSVPSEAEAKRVVEHCLQQGGALAADYELDAAGEDYVVTAFFDASDVIVKDTRGYVLPLPTGFKLVQMPASLRSLLIPDTTG